MSFTIVDNFLSEHNFKNIYNLCLKSEQFQLYYSDYVVEKEEIKTDKNIFYLTHNLYKDNEPQSDLYHSIVPLFLEKIKDLKTIIRVKANFYPNQNKVCVHGMHTDYPFPHKGFIYYVNTNNGHTILEDGTKIESIENRALFFDSSKPHSSTTCTDKQMRINFNMNYF
jgi:hypothetical protein